MSVVYRITDTFDVKIGKVTFKISPLNYKVKADMQALVISGKPMDAAVIAVKNSIKGVAGLSLPDGSAYALEFEDDGSLTDNSINDLMNIPEASQLNVVAITLIHGMPDGEFLDPQTGAPLDGVKMVKGKPARKKSQARQ